MPSIIPAQDAEGGKMPELEKFRGAMAGLALGDALGAPLEGMKSGHIKDAFGYVTGFVDTQAVWRNKPYRYRAPGIYTDDTQQALCLSESLVRCFGYQAKDFAKTLLSLWQTFPETKSGAFRGIGPTFFKVMEQLAEGAEPDKTGLPSAGIGAAMRVAPVGLYFYDDHQRLLKAAIEQSLLTHKDPRALALAACLAYALARAVSGGWQTLKPKERAEDLVCFAGNAEKIIEQEYIAALPSRVFDFFGLFYRSIEPLPHWMGMEHELVFRQIVNLANQAFPSEKITSPSQNFALAAGVTALFLGTAGKDFMGGTLEAVNLGRDADSIAAMTGALLGARFGESSIPHDWKAALKNYEQVCLRGEALWQKSVAGLKLRRLKEMETELSIYANQERDNFVKKMVARGEYDPEALAKKREEKKRLQELAKAVARPKRRSKEGRRRREKAPWRGWED